MNVITLKKLKVSQNSQSICQTQNQQHCCKKQPKVEAMSPMSDQQAGSQQFKKLKAASQSKTNHRCQAETKCMQCAIQYARD